MADLDAVYWHPGYRSPVKKESNKISVRPRKLNWYATQVNLPPCPRFLTMNQVCYFIYFFLWSVVKIKPRLAGNVILNLLLHFSPTDFHQVFCIVAFSAHNTCVWHWKRLHNHEKTGKIMRKSKLRKCVVVYNQLIQLWQMKDTHARSLGLSDVFIFVHWDTQVWRFVFIECQFLFASPTFSPCYIIEHFGL